MTTKYDHMTASERQNMTHWDEQLVALREEIRKIHAIRAKFLGRYPAPPPADMTPTEALEIIAKEVPGIFEYEVEMVRERLRESYERE